MTHGAQISHSAEAEIVEHAINNVLRRKRSDILGLQLKYEAGCRDKGGPVKGLGSEIEGLRREIEALEAALRVLHE